MNAKLDGAIKYWFRVAVIFFALYILYPLGGLCKAVWEGVKGFVQGVKDYRSGEAHRFFPPWSYTKQLLDEAERLRKEGK